MGVGWGYYLFVLLYSPPCTEPLSPSLPPGDASLSSILPEVLFWSTHCCIKRKRTATKRNVPLVMKILLNLFLCIHDDRKWFHQMPKATHSFCLSVQGLIDFEEIIVFFCRQVKCTVWNVKKGSLKGLNRLNQKYNQTMYFECWRKIISVKSPNDTL